MVAMKKLHNPGELDNFMKEVKILSQLRHPNIVSLYGIFIGSEKTYYIVTVMTLQGVADISGIHGTGRSQNFVVEFGQTGKRTGTF